MKISAVISFLIFIASQTLGSAAWAQDASGGAAPASTPVEVPGYTKEAAEVKAGVDMLVAEMKKTEAANGFFPNVNQIKNFVEAVTYYERFHGSCVKTQSSASWFCREETSPQLQSSLQNINMVMSMAKQALVNDACSNFAKAMNLAQTGLTLYTSACSTARVACESACTTVNTNLKRIADANMATAFKCEVSPAVSADPNLGPAAAIACSQFTKMVIGEAKHVAALVGKETDLAQGNTQSIAAKSKACDYEYPKMLTSAGLGIIASIQGMKQGQACDEQTDGTGGKVADNLQTKCAAAENATLPECICYANPRTPGCANSYQKPGEAAASGLTAGNMSNRSPSTALGGTGFSGGDPSETSLGSKPEGDVSGGGVGAPTGGGPGLGGSGGGFGNGANKEEVAKKALDANILGGSGGGGGGGGGWNFSGSSGSGEKYRAYLPGGVKDPNKGLAGQQSWRNEVTGQGGKSNWEKVKDRYRDNKNSLLNN